MSCIKDGHNILMTFPSKAEEPYQLLQVHKKITLGSSFIPYPHYSLRTLALLRSDEQLKV